MNLVHGCSQIMEPHASLVTLLELTLQPTKYMSMSMSLLIPKGLTLPLPAPPSMPPQNR
jgi:hypothetical protein